MNGVRMLPLSGSAVVRLCIMPANTREYDRCKHGAYNDPGDHEGKKHSKVVHNKPPCFSFGYRYAISLSEIWLDLAYELIIVSSKETVNTKKGTAQAENKYIMRSSCKWFPHRIQ